MLSRWLVSLLFLGSLVWWLGPIQLIGQLSDLHPMWIGLALMAGVIQVFLSASRWWFSAKSLGVPLSFRAAIEEYYLASLINQILPGGVVGDAYRAKRHADVATTKMMAWFAVIIERFSGQSMLALFTGIVLLFSSTWHQVFDKIPTEVPWLGMDGLTAWAVLSVLVMCVLMGAWLVNRFRGIGLSFCRATIHVFWPWPRLVVQVLASLLIVGSYVVVMVLAAWALGVDRDFISLAVLMPPLLLAMVIPITVSGWGLRELVAAGVWTSVGLDPAQGVAVSVVYGLLIFLTALPGVFMWRGRYRPPQPPPPHNANQ